MDMKDLVPRRAIFPPIKFTEPRGGTNSGYYSILLRKPYLEDKRGSVNATLSGTYEHGKPNLAPASERAFLSQLAHCTGSPHLPNSEIFYIN